MPPHSLVIIGLITIGLTSLACEGEQNESRNDAPVRLVSDAAPEPDEEAMDGAAPPVDAAVDRLDQGTPVSVLRDAAPEFEPDAQTPDAAAALECTATEEGVYSFTATDFGSGEERLMCSYSGRVLMIVNTAANCGFNGQYEQLQMLHQRYEQQGLTILGFLTNDFADQGGSQDEIEMCNERFGVTFEQFEHVGVTQNSRDGQHPLFTWLTSQTGFEGDVPWNFHKFLISHDGRMLGRWDHFILPDNPLLVDPLRAALLARVQSNP